MNNLSKGISLICLSLLAISCTTTISSDWKMKEAPIMTQWADDIDIDEPWNLYPRPYLMRDNWINLNGLWNYIIAPAGSERPDTLAGNILVPYPIESALSGVMERVDKDDQIWYQRNIQLPKYSSDEKLILHFEAVDWHSKIWIDKNLIGEHKGGYSPFEFDITEYVKPGKECELWLSVWDPTTEGTQPVGKQNSNPRGIWYTPTSGIWQTVWLETVPDVYVTDYLVVPDIDKESISLTTELANALEGDKIELVVKLHGDELASEITNPGEKITIDIPDMELWTTDDPVLYDLEIKVIREDETIDKVQGYFGMRKIALGKDKMGITRIFLNNEFVFQNGPLDQGFWPDGLYTPPTEEAMIYDLKVLKDMGFNMLRKHVKVENRRFYYWTDKMGMLVWQDMPNGYFGRNVADIEEDTEHKLQFEQELKELVHTLDNHPSIVMWVPFNEGWGQYDTERIVDYVKLLDPTRLINNVSGWVDKGVGDVHDIHNYPEPKAPPVEEDRAIVLGEFGGLGLPVEDHTWQKDKNWGYENMEGANSLLSKYESFYDEVDRLVKVAGLSAVVYTQTTDVEIETNGLMTYDRKVDKMGKDKIRNAHRGYTPPHLSNPIQHFINEYSVELISRKSGAQIHYTDDGSEPARSSKLYSNPFIINESTVIKAKTFWENGTISRMGEFTIEKVEPIPSSDVNPSKGLNYSLFDEAWEMLPDFSKFTPVKTGVVNKIGISKAGKRTQDFGFVFKGFLKVPKTDIYQIIVSSDDGGRLIINGEQVVNYDGIHGMGEKVATLALEKGYHQIEFLYFQHLGGQGLKVFWESSSISKQEIGPENYSH